MRRLGLLPLLLALAVVPLLASAGSARTTGGLGFALVATGFDKPLYVTAPSSEPTKLYVVEKTGRVKVLVNGVVQPTPYLDLHDEVSTLEERGLLSIAFDQRYAVNHFVYASYSGLNGDIHIDRFTAVGGVVDTSTRHQLLLVPHPTAAHNGGLLVAAPDGRLYLALGDGDGNFGDQSNHSQNPELMLGKLLSLDLTHANSKWRIIALGFRNPWRYSFDRETGDLYIGDVGAATWEEVDIVRAGDSLMNMGWPAYEGNKVGRAGAPLASHYYRLVTPNYVFPHLDGQCAITGGYVYEGTAVPLARGRYVYGDFCTGLVRTTKVVNGVFTNIVNVAQKLPQLTSFGEDAAGELYATTLSGSLYKLQQ